MKARGMKHSNQVREFIISNRGLTLIQVYLGPKGILLGSERKEQELQKLKGQELKDQEDRKEMARRRQENGVIRQPKQKIGK
jgi:circadian clock protein KaiC